MLTTKPFRAVMLLVALVSICLCLPQVAQAKKKPLKPVFQQVGEDPNLPRVLLIGDSISIGYTIPTRNALKGIANVQRPSTNCGPTFRGVENLDQWLGEKPWDVIHFNFGLHDQFRGKNRMKPSEGDNWVPIDQYEKNLEKIVQRLKKTGATLIWCSTTPVPKGAKGRTNEDTIKYNEVALRIMKKYNIPVDDLYSFCLPRLEELQRPANVHFTGEGSTALGKEVARVIKEHLGKKSKN